MPDPEISVHGSPTYERDLKKLRLGAEDHAAIAVTIDEIRRALKESPTTRCAAIDILVDARRDRVALLVLQTR